MLGALSVTPYFYYECQNWLRKKSLLKDLLKKQTKNQNTLNGFYTDLNSNSNYIDEFISIFFDEIQQFGKDIQSQSVKINTLWSVEYNQYDYHEVHTHGDSDFSAILYVDYKKNVHPSTCFVIDKVDPISKKTIINRGEFVDEGGIMFFPSNVLHYSNPNQSFTKKTIVSFNLDIYGNINDL